MRRLALIVAALAALATGATPARAATLQPVGTFSAPVFVTSDPDDATRLFVVEQNGVIRLVAGGATSTFLDIRPLVAAGGEQGLLSMAFAPDYRSTGRFYVYYTSNASSPVGDIQIDEFTASGDVTDPATRRPIITVPHRDAGNHNGGQLQFGPDGYLYAGTGDGGGGGDTFRNAQNLNSLLGKMLRIDPRPSGGAPYTVPADNPFAGAAVGADEIWSYGLRNPFRFSFDRETGALLIGDVGQNAHEEIDYEPQPAAGRGDNFGWSCREGFSAYPTSDPLCSGASGFTEPIHDYPHDAGGCSVTGGYLVRDPSLGDLYGRYVYADHCVGEIRSLVPGLPRATGDRSEGLSVSRPSSFGEDACGHVYVASLNGQVSRLVGDAPSACVTGGDTTAPAIEADAPRRQRLGGRLRLRLATGEAATVSARLKIVASGRNARRATVAKPKRKTVELGAGASGRVAWRLRGKAKRAARAADGKLTARFVARGTDAAGNRGKPVRARSRLKR